MTEFHGYNTPTEGQTDWHVPLNENFEEIDTDVEVRDVEANRDQFTAKAGAKFLSTDTGRVYVGDGEQWQLLTAVGSESMPDIVSYEDGNTSYAETQAETFTGSDILDATQKAVDAQAPSGRISVAFRPGYYVVDNRLSITGDTAKGLDRLSIFSPEGSVNSVRFETKSLSGGIMLEIDPDAGDVPSDRIYGVRLANFSLDHTDDPALLGSGGSSDRDEDGVYINDVSDLHISRLGIKGYAHGLRLRNIYRAKIDYVYCQTSGSNSQDKVPIQVETGQTTSTKPWWSNKVHNAVNHVQFNWLDGGNIEGDGFIKMSTPEVEGQTPRIRMVGIHQPNTECRKDTFLHTHAHAHVVISSCQVQNPGPVIDQDGGRVELHGGIIEGPDKLLESAGGHAMITGVDVTASGASGAIVDFSNGWLNISNLRTYGGQRAVRVTGANAVNITGLHAQKTDEASVLIQNGDKVNLSNIIIQESNAVDNESENPIWIEGGGAITIDNAIVEVDGDVPSRAAIYDQFDSGPLSIGEVVLAGNVTDVMSSHSGSEFMAWNGSVTVSGGTTSVTVEHQLAGTPDLGDIAVTPNGPLGSASTWYISNIGSSTFDINLDSDPGRDVTFGWSAAL